MRQHELAMRFGSESRTLQPWYDTTREIWDIWSIGFDGVNWTPVRQLPQSEGRCRMEMGSGIVGGKLVYVWPVDGKTYPDPHVRSAQIRYAEFEPPERPASRDGMRPFVSRETGVADGAPTEQEDLARVRAFAGRTKNRCACSAATCTGTPTSRPTRSGTVISTTPTVTPSTPPRSTSSA